MPLIVTPRQLNLRAELYHQLGIMITAGLSVHSTLQHLKKNPPSAALREPVSRWLEELEQGHTISQSLRNIGKWMPSFDIALIDAAERSGRLDACFKLLSVYYRERAQMARQMILDMLYPLFILHFAILIFPLIDLVTHGNFVRFLWMTAGIALPAYVIVFLIIYACQGRHGEAWRSRMESMLGCIPVLRTARRELALARLSAALESLLNAGVPIISAWELAATASGSPALDRTVQSWKPAVEAGGTYSELVSGSPLFPELFANLYHTGEVSGTLDQSLTRLHTLYLTEGMRRMKALSTWTPKIIYFGILLMVAWKIVSWYAGYYNQVSNAIDGK